MSAGSNGATDKPVEDKPEDKAEEKVEAPAPAPAPAPAAVPGPPPRPTKKQDRRMRALGRSRTEVSELALGTWGLTGEAYGPVYHREVDRVIDRAIELGITLFDTADVYGAGNMEKLLGERLDAKEHRVVTKIGTCLGEQPRKRFNRESLQTALDKSRERLKRDCLDVVLLHGPSLAAFDADDTFAWLRERKENKELALWGVSCGSADVAEKAVERGADVVMLAYNLFHQKDLHTIADRVAATETAVLARTVLAHGLLAGHWSKTKVFFDTDHRSKRWSSEELGYRLQQLAAVRHLIGGEVITLRAAALRFVLANDLVSSAVLGPRSVTQLNQLVHEAGAAPPYLADELLMELPERLRAVGLEP